jgi:quercetin dioxygenase-like cupin family protein
MLDRIDLVAPVEAGNGVVWSASPEGFHANLVALDAGGEIGAHRNDEVDVLVVVVAGGVTIEVDGDATPVGAGTAVVIPKGTERRVVAGAGGARYLTVHARRAGLSIRT